MKEKIDKKALFFKKIHSTFAYIKNYSYFCAEIEEK